MKTIKPIAVHLDRLGAALSAQDIDLKRTKLLEVAAAAFGYHNTHECTAASQRGDLTPPPAGVVCRLSLSTGETLLVLRDPVSEAPYAIDESFVEQVVEDERREAYGPSPYGRLLDLSEVAAHQATALVGTDGSATTSDADTLRILVELETDGPVTPEVVRSNVHQAIHQWRGAAGLSADDDEGMVGEIMTRIIPATHGQAASSAGRDQLNDIMRAGHGSKIHVAVIHHKHGIDIRLGTTLAIVSRQVGEYVRENWDEAWQNDQAAERKDRIGLPEIPDGLDDDKAEEMYFAAMTLFDATDYVTYEVLDVAGLAAGEPAQPATSPEPFPGVPDDLWTVYAARDGDTVRSTYRVGPDEDPEMKGREIAAKAFSLDLDDYLEEPENEDDEIDYSLFDGDLDGIDVEPAAMDPSLQEILAASWEAACRLPAGDPLRERIRQQVNDAMPHPDKY
jgi:hypothetical protein